MNDDVFLAAFQPNDDSAISPIWRNQLTLTDAQVTEYSLQMREVLI